MQLLDLPTEIIVLILFSLPPQDLTKCSQLCRMFWLIFHESSTLQYYQDLYLSRTEDNPGCRLSHAEKLQLLRNREKSWIKCEPDFTKLAPINFSPGSVYDLSAGVYILGDATRHRLKYLRLPSKPEDSVEWLTFEPVVTDWKEQRGIVDFAINLYEHDLIALITANRRVQGAEIFFMIDLSIHEFSTGRFHPLAKQTIIPITRSEIQWGTPSINCEIVGEHLALVTTFWRNPLSRCTVYVYQWRTGKQLLHIDGEPDTYGGIIFLSEHLILLPNTANNTLEIWRIPSPTEDPPTCPVRVLGLPVLNPGHLLRYISCRSEPNPTAPGATLKSDKPFHPSPEESIVLLHLRIHGQTNITLITVFVHRSSLLSLVVMDDDEREQRLAAGEHGMRVPVPWLAWAPPVAYCMDCGGDLPSRWITTTCGQRFVMLPTDDWELDVFGNREPAPLVVYDFGKGSVKKVESEYERLSLEDKLRYTGPVVRRAMSLPEESAKIFADPIESYLPFVETRTEQTYGFDGALMDDERIIGIKLESSDSQERTLHAAFVVFAAPQDSERLSSLSKTSTTDVERLHFTEPIILQILLDLACAMPVHFPLEIWTVIISHLPHDNLYKLLGVNQSIFDHVMDMLYKEVVYMIDWNTRQVDGSNVYQLRAYPSIAERTKSLRMIIPFPKSQISSRRGLFVNLNLGRMALSQRRDIKAFVPEGTNATHLTHVECLQLDISNPIIYKSFIPYITTLWDCHSQNLRTLNLQFDLPALYTFMSPLMKSLPILPHLTEFEFHIMNHDSKWRKPVATTAQTTKMTSWLITLITSSSLLSRLFLVLPQEIDTTRLFTELSKIPLPHLTYFGFSQSSGKDSFPKNDALSAFLATQCRHALRHVIFEPFVSISWEKNGWMVAEKEPYKTWFRESFASLDLPQLRVLQFTLPFSFGEGIFINARGEPYFPQSRVMQTLDTLVLLTRKEKIQTRYLRLIFGGSGLPDTSKSWRLRKLSVAFEEFFVGLGVVEDGSGSRWKYARLELRRGLREVFSSVQTLSVSRLVAEGIDTGTGYPVFFSQGHLRVGDTPLDYYYKLDDDEFMKM
ncbi:hypothetical protein VNI00_006120 [Paramarasmius palmivorus]|uniref:F-box domain-containing protein n=1 Tax=Paramarasmius palmivorus TaxID=297713 RepID=A0AAW0D8F6_9AGAR